MMIFKYTIEYFLKETCEEFTADGIVFAEDFIDAAKKVCDDYGFLEDQSGLIGYKIDYYDSDTSTYEFDNKTRGK